MTKGNTYLKYILCVFISFTVLVSCKSDDFAEETEDPVVEEPEPEPEPEACFESGDIIVSNSGSDAVTVLDSAGNFKRTAFNVSTALGEAFYGMDINTATGELLLVVDPVDRVMAISAEDCTSRNFILSAQLTGNLRGLTQLTSGDVLVVESNVVERFTSAGDRVTSGGWPKSLQTAGTQVSAMAGGGFVLCSNTTDRVGVYDSSGTISGSLKASGIASTTDAMGCIELLDGSIATAWSGTTDTVAIYSSNLSTTLFTYSNTSVLAAPGGIAQRANGNILVVDRTFHYIVELTSDGTYVQTLGAGLLNIPEHILVVP